MGFMAKQPNNDSVEPRERSCFSIQRYLQTTQQSKNERKLKKLLQHIERIQVNRIYVRPHRSEWLRAQEHSSFVITPQGSYLPSKPTLLALNFLGKGSSLERSMSSIYSVIEVDARSENLKLLKRILTGKRDATGFCCFREMAKPEVDAVVILCFGSLTAFQALVLGTTFLKGKPIVVLSEGASPETCRDVLEWTAGTWPVLNNSDLLLEYLQTELPRMILLKKIIHRDIESLLEKHNKVNLAKVTLTRGLVAVVPLGVTGVNALSVLKLCRNCMFDTGMLQEEGGIMAKDAWEAGLLNAVTGGARDVHHVATQGSIIERMLSASSFDKALATLDVVGDLFLPKILNVATTGAAIYRVYKTRTQVVASICDTLTMLQLTFCIDAALRRNH